MKKKQLCMLVLNEVTSDPRVTKEAESLSTLYDLTVIGARQSSQQSSSEQCEGYKVERVDDFKKQNKKNRINRMDLLRKLYRKMIAMMKVGKKALQTRADVYHAHDFEMLPLAFIAAKWKKAKLVYDSHELWVEQRADFPVWLKKIVKWVEGMLIRRTDRVITVNQSISNELQHRYNLNEKPIVIHNFTKKQKIERTKDSTEKKDKIIVLYHGGYMKDRGLVELIKAVELLPSHVVVQLRGMGPLEETLRTFAEPYVREGKIEFLSPVSMKELVQSAGNADIGVIPYQPTCLNNYYSLPNKLSEYLMAHLAVCASDLPELRNLNNKVQFGELFNPGQPESIAEAILKLIKDKDYLNRCKKNAAAWVATEGNWEKESKILTDLYCELLGDAK